MPDSWEWDCAWLLVDSCLIFGLSVPVYQSVLTVNSQMDRYLYARPSVSGEHFHPLKTWNREAWQRIGSRFRGQTASDGFSSLNVNYSFTCHSESTKDIVRKRNTQREYSCSFSPASLSMMALSILNICWGKSLWNMTGLPQGPTITSAHTFEWMQSFHVYNHCSRADFLMLL